MNDDDLFAGTGGFGLSVTGLLKKYPTLPAKTIVALAIITLLERTVTPFRLCECGCGEPIHGKAHLASSACRKRVQRERDAEREAGPRQFNIALQMEIPVPIPSICPPAPVADVPRDSVPDSSEGQDTGHTGGQLEFSACRSLPLTATPETVTELRP